MKNTLLKVIKSNVGVSLLISTGLTALFCLISYQKGAVYTMNDDMVLRAIVSGRYSGAPSYYMIFCTFPFSFILYFLYSTLNQVDWYGVLQIILIIGFLWYTIYSILKNTENLQRKFIYACLIFGFTSLIFSNLLTQISFTTTAGFIASCCLILYWLPENTKIKKIVIWSGLVLSSGIRLTACLMVLALFIPVWAYKNYGNKKELIKDGVFGVMIGLSILSCFVVENKIIMNDDWKDFSNYNIARSEYFDYYSKNIDTLPQQEQTELFKAAGFTEEEIVGLHKLNIFAFNDDIFTKMDKLIQECQKRGVERVTNENRKNIIKELLKTPITYIYIGSIIVFAFISISGKQKKDILALIAFITIQSIMLVYLIYKGRLPQRVYIPLCFAYISVNIFFIIYKIKEEKKKIFEKGTKILLALSVPIFIISAFAMQSYDSSNLPGDAILKYFERNQDKIYIFSVKDVASISLIDKQKTNNYIEMSGWSAFSPLYYNKLDSYGVSTLKELATKEDVYFVTKDKNVKKLLPNEAQKYGDGTEVIDEVGDYSIYKIYQEN